MRNRSGGVALESAALLDLRSSEVIALEQTSVARSVETVTLSLPTLVVIRGSLAGIMAALVLLGRTSDMLPHLYISLLLFTGLYLLACGKKIMSSVLAYLTSRTLVVRWVFLLWALVSLWWSSTLGDASIQHFITLVEIHILGLVFYDAARRLGQTRWIVGMLFVGTLVGALHALYMGVSTDALRLRGVYGNPNVLAVTTLLGLTAFVSGIDLGRDGIRCVLSYVGAAVLAAGVLASTSRKGIIGIPLLIGIGVTFRHGRRRGLIFAGLIAAGIGVAASTTSAFHRYWHYSLTRATAVLHWISSTRGVDVSVVERGRFLERGRALIEEAPLIGHGLDAFRWVSGEARYSHSNYIELGVAVGLIGLILYYGLHVSLLRGAYLRRAEVSAERRFLVILVILMLILDMALVSYRMKLPTILMITCAGWLERRSDVAGARLIPCNQVAQC